MTASAFRFEPERYEALFAAKCQSALDLMAPFSPPEPARYASTTSGFRLRAEFRIWHEDHELHYVMFPPGDPKTPHVVADFPIAAPRIRDVMPQLRELLRDNPALRQKLFQVEFLSTLSGDLLITLIYHRALDNRWEEAAAQLSKSLSCEVIGRSRKQKCVLGRDWVTEALSVAGKEYRYRQPEQCFTQPNGGINEQMISWLLSHCPQAQTDLLELYCGVGNFTIPLADRFRAVLATELSKRATEAAKYNAEDNAADNIEFARLSAEEMSAAMAGERPFRRLAHLKQPLGDYRFSTLLVDPPRAGLDTATLALAAQFDRVLYISCNPETLSANLAVLTDSHEVSALAFFDQFPYTAHLESGVILTRL